MKRYESAHTGNVKTKKQWIREFEEAREDGDLQAVDTFNQFVQNGDLREVHTW